MLSDIRRIEVPAWADDYSRRVEPNPGDPMCRELQRAVQDRRAEFLAAVHQAVVERLDRCALDHAFPRRSVLTGEYYLTLAESYHVSEWTGRPGVTVSARCLGRDDEQLTPGEADDYLAISVGVELDPAADRFAAKAFSLQVTWSERALARFRAEPVAAPDPAPKVVPGR